MGCGSEEKTNVAQAQEDAGFPMLWLGESFEGHELSSVDGEGPLTGANYGTCDPGAGVEASCPIPYQLQEEDICEWAATAQEPKLRDGPGDSLTFPEGGGLVVLTGRTYVKIFGEELGAAARALRPLGQTQPAGPLPAPVTETGQEACA